jgi:hypothetical protein
MKKLIIALFFIFSLLLTTGVLADHVSVSTDCQQVVLYNYGTVSCSTPAMSIPTNAVNISSTTYAHITPYNANYDGNASRTFGIIACNPYSGHFEDCDYDDVRVCRFPDYTWYETHSGTYTAGQAVTGWGWASVPTNCIIGTNSYFILYAYTNLQYDTVGAVTKSVTLTISPDHGTTSTVANFIVSTSNMSKPYNISYYYVRYSDPANEVWISTVYNVYDDVKTIQTNLGDVTGTHYWYVTATDSEGTIMSNNFTVTVTGAGISTFDVSVVPTTGTVAQIFRMSTTAITGGSPPYSVDFYLNSTDLQAGHCTGIGSGGTCVVDHYLLIGYWRLFAVATDSAAGTRISTYTWVNVTGAPMGQYLNATLSVLPSTGSTDTIFIFTLSIEGGAKPYYIDWRDHHSPICYNETYDRDPPWSTTERYQLWAGSHSIDVQVISSDGQTALSNPVPLEVSWVNYINITAYDCRGTLGADIYPPSATTTTLPPAQIPNASRPVPQLVNETEWVEAGYGWALIFVSPIGLITIITLVVSAVIARFSGTQFGIISFLFLWFILVLFTGVLPTWIFLVLIIIAGFILVKVGAGIFGK